MVRLANFFGYLLNIYYICDIREFGWKRVVLNFTRHYPGVGNVIRKIRRIVNRFLVVCITDWIRSVGWTQFAFCFKNFTFCSYNARLIHNDSRRKLIHYFPIVFFVVCRKKACLYIVVILLLNTWLNQRNKKNTNTHTHLFSKRKKGARNSKTNFAWLWFDIKQLKYAYLRKQIFTKYVLQIGTGKCPIKTQTNKFHLFHKSGSIGAYILN